VLNKDQKPTTNDHFITVIMQMTYFYIVSIQQSR